MRSSPKGLASRHGWVGLEQLDLNGGIITIDAMGTQTAIAQQIKEARADYTLTLKRNHLSLGW